MVKKEDKKMLRHYDFYETEEIKKTMSKLDGGPEVIGASIGIRNGNTVNFMLDDRYFKHYVKMSTYDARRFATTLLDMCDKAEAKNKKPNKNVKSRRKTYKNVEYLDPVCMVLAGALLTCIYLKNGI